MIPFIPEAEQPKEALQTSRMQLADLITFLPNATLAIDKEKRVIIWNRAIEKMTGIPASEMIGKGDFAYSIPFYGEARPMLLDLLFLDIDAHAGPYPNLVREGDALSAELFCPALYHQKGAWIFCKASPLYDHAGNIIGSIESIRDITAQRQAEDALRISEEKYRLITENVCDVIWVYNLTKQRYSYVSPSVYHLRGFTAEEVMNERLEEGLTPSSFLTVKDSMANGIEAFIKNPQMRNHKISEVQQPCKNGYVIWVEVSTNHQYAANGDLEIVGVSRNIENRKQAEERILYLSYHDQLTGLYNRRFYEEELKRLDTKRNYPLTIVMGDVNGLKLVNDSFGHAMGDELLGKAATVLKNGCRADDIISRLGGDEFAVILPKTDVLETEGLIVRMKDLLSKEKVCSIDVSISFGYKTKSREEEKIQEIFKNAEDNMYRNKLFESSSMRSRTINLIMGNLYQKFNREHMHSIRVSEICEALAVKMGFDKGEIAQIKLAGLMHDIGKVEINGRIINKPNRLDTDEWEEMKRHPEIGYRILSSVNEFSQIADYVLEHQERWDGKGYPRGLAGEKIVVQARIIAVADSYDAMTSNRVYGKTLSENEALEEIRRCSGTQFDPAIVKVLVALVTGKEDGT